MNQNNQINEGNLKNWQKYGQLNQIYVHNTNQEIGQTFKGISKHNHHSGILNALSYILFLFVFTLFLSCCNCTQMRIVEYMSFSQNRQINLMRILRQHRKKTINLNRKPYVCTTAIKPKNYEGDAPDAAKIAAQYVAGNVPTLPKLNTSIYESQLELLNDGIGVRHFTKEFIYGYKHKKIISQYDDETTKYNNQKKQFQNFTMGTYKIDYGTYGKPENDKVKLIYQTYQNSYFYNRIKQQKDQKPLNLFSTNQVPLKLRKSDYALSHAHIDKQNQLITLSRPLQSDPHKKPLSYSINFQCQTKKQQNSSTTQYYHSMNAISVSNYQLITISPIPSECNRIVEIVRTVNWTLGLNPDINIFDNKLSGDIDQFCDRDLDYGINVGDYLLISTQRTVQYALKTNQKLRNTNPYQKNEVKYQYNEQAGQIKLQPIKTNKNTNPSQNNIIQQHFLIKIQQIIGQNLYLINAKLPWTLRPKKCQILKKTPYRSLHYGGQLDLKSTITNQNQKIPNILQDKIIQFQYNGNNLINRFANEMKYQNHHRIQTGLELLCLTQVAFSIAPTSPTTLVIGVTIGALFGSSYYQVYPWMGYNKMRAFRDIGQFMGRMSCVTYAYQQIGNEKQKNYQTSTQLLNTLYPVLKLSKNVYKLKILGKNSQKTTNQIIKNYESTKEINENSILILTLSQESVMEVLTTTQQQQQQQPETKTTKQQAPESAAPSPQPQPQPANAQKKVQNQNKYILILDRMYKKQTAYRNKTKIQVERLENQFYQNISVSNSIIIYNSIWRAGDFVKFPRFLFGHNQKITGIVVKHGTVFIRVIDLNVMNPQLYAVSSSQLHNRKLGYGPKIRPPQTLSTEYQFKHGTFCGGNIKKNRQTLVKIKCGQSWFKLHSVSQISPCSYEMVIISQFVCDKNVIFPALKEGFNIFNGTICVYKDLSSTG